MLLPTAQNKLLMHWKGPYTVVKKVNDLNYLVQVDSDIKRFHINMLKEYHIPELCCSSMQGCDEDIEIGHRVLTPEQVNCLKLVEAQFAPKSSEKTLGCAAVIPEGEEENTPKTTETRQSESLAHIKVSQNLSEAQQQEVNNLFLAYSNVFSDKPGVAKVEEHKIHLTSTTPVRVKPYPIPLRMVDAIKKEVNEMEQAGIIEKSESPYCSPIVVIQKKDGSVRICGDYRRVNAVTQVDAEPMSDQ